MSNKYLMIDKCNKHNFWAISIGDENSSTRLTPSKCCGTWQEQKRFKIDRRMCDEVIEQFTIAREDCGDD